jgi:hypothetical protein
LESAAWGLIGTIAGALASIGTTWLANRSAESLHQQRATEDRIERASAFQRQTLLDLQEALHDALRLVTRGHIEDRLALQQGNVWGKNMLGPDLGEQIRLAHRRVAILVERIADDKLRTQVKDLMFHANLILSSATALESEAKLQQTYLSADQVLETLGTALRSHY